MAYLVVLWRDGRISSPALVGLLAVVMVVQFYLFLETFAGMTAVWLPWLSRLATRWPAGTGGQRS